MMIRNNAGRSSRPYVWLCLLVVLGLPASARSQPRCAKGWPWTDDLHVAGQVGSRDVRGYLGEAFATTEDRGLFGVFFYPATWTPAERGQASMFAVDGTFAQDCSLTLKEVDGAGEEQARWQLHFVTDTRLEGRRTSARGAPLSISLGVVLPPDCSGKARG